MTQAPNDDGSKTVADGDFEHMNAGGQLTLASKIEAALADVSDAELTTLCAAVGVEIGNKHAAAEAVAAMKVGIDVIKQIAPLAALVL